MNNKKKNRAEFLCKVAGVTFRNPDGESRQDIIREIIRNNTGGDRFDGPGRLTVSVYRDPQTGKERPVLEVWMEDRQIGIVPSEKTGEVSRHARTQSGSVIVSLKYFKQYDIYTAKVFTANRSAPTKKMEQAVNRILEIHPGLERPEKTFDAYRDFLTIHNNGYEGRLRDQVIRLTV